MTDLEPDLGIFEGFDSIAAILAFVHHQYRDDGFRELLAAIEVDQESLERAAAELAGVGLQQVSAIVREAAASALPDHVMHCPYAETDHHNYQSWQKSHQRRELLRRA